MAGLLIVPGAWPVFDAAGNPVSGATISFFVPGTSTPKAVYSDSTLTTSLGSVLTTNAGGEPTTLAGAVARLWWGEAGQAYDVRIQATGLDRTWEDVFIGPDVDADAGVFDVDSYGADPTGVADSTSAIQTASAALDLFGGGILRGKPGGTYKVYPDKLNTSSLGSFTDCKGVKLEFDGCTFSISRVFDGTEVVFPFVFERCRDVDLGSLFFNCTQIDTPALAFTRGIVGVTFNGQNSGITFGVIKQNGGKGALDIARSTALGHTITDRTYSVRGGALECSGVGYVYNGRNNGDDVLIERIYANSPSRPFIIYGARGVTLSSVEHVGTPYAQGLILANSTGSDLFENDPITRDITINYRSTVNENARLELSVRGTGPCQHLNHKFDMQIDQTQAGSATQQAFIITADSAAGVVDTVGGRGHIVNGLKLSGRITGCPAATSVLDLAATVRGNWTGSTLRRVSLEDLTIDGDATAFIRTNWDVFPDGIRMAGFEFNGTWTTTGTNWGPWARPSFRATKSANQTALTTATYVDVTFDTEAYDYGSDFASNSWTPPRGRVTMTAALSVTGLTGGSAANIAILKNGSFFRAQEVLATAAGAAQIAITVDDQASGSDVYKVQFNGTESGAGSITVSNSATRTFFSGTHVGR